MAKSVGKYLRLSAYIAVVGMGVAGLAANEAYGDIQESALLIGEELGNLDDVGIDRPIVLNGQPMYVSSHVDERTVDEVLDEAERLCEEDAGKLLADTIAELDAKRAAMGNLGDDAKGHRASNHPLEGVGVSRKSNRLRGFVSCFVDPSGSKAGLVDRAKMFAGSGDLADVGELRYVFAKRTENSRTHVVSAWTRGSFQLDAVFPPQGVDAPGEDPQDAVRPTGATRLLEARVEGVPYGAWVYETKALPKVVLEDLDNRMVEAGWTRLIADSKGDARVFSLPGRDLYVSSVVDKGRTIVTYTQLAPRESDL